MKNKLVIIPGVTGAMGNAYKKYFSSRKDFEVVGFTHRKNNKKTDVIYADFLNKEDIEHALTKINLKKYTEIVVIHSIGKFHFEWDGKALNDHDGDGINDEIYASNYLTFVNFTESLLRLKTNNQKITFCAFGSISDRFLVPWWTSYSKSKQLLKKYMQDILSHDISCVLVCVSSTEKEEERPFADKTYWLTCKEVVKRSYKSILNSDLNFQEIFIFKPSPSYTKEYFIDLEKLKSKWLHESFNI